jgi:hypothetical protein
MPFENSNSRDSVIIRVISTIGWTLDSSTIPCITAVVGAAGVGVASVT